MGHVLQNVVVWASGLLHVTSEEAKKVMVSVGTHVSEMVKEEWYKAGTCDLLHAMDVGKNTHTSRVCLVFTVLCWVMILHKVVGMFRIKRKNKYRPVPSRPLPTTNSTLGARKPLDTTAGS